MIDIAARFVAPGGVFLLTLVFGLWLSRRGKPYNGILFNLHKLIALAAVVITAVQVYGLFQAAHPQALLIVLCMLVGLAVVALFVTGALMSANRPAYRVLLVIHNSAPFVVVGGLALALYLLGGRD